MKWRKDEISDAYEIGRQTGEVYVVDRDSEDEWMQVENSRFAEQRIERLDLQQHGLR